MSGVRRYQDFRDQLGIANSVLTARLRRLDRGRRVHPGAVLRGAAALRIRAHRPRPRPVEGAADDLVLGSGVGDRAHRAAAADVPPRVRRGVLPGHGLPGLRPAGRHLRCARHVRPERRLRAVGAARHHPAPLRGRLAGPRPGAPDHRADRQPLVGGGPGRRVPRRPAVHRHAGDDGRTAHHRLGPAAHLLPDGRAGDGRGHGRLRPGRVPADGQGPGLLPARHGDARLGRPVVPRPRGTRHPAHPHHLRRRVPPGPALLRLRPASCTAPRSRSAATRPNPAPDRTPTDHFRTTSTRSPHGLHLAVTGACSAARTAAGPGESRSGGKPACREGFY